MPEDKSDPSVTVERAIDGDCAAYNIKIGVPVVEINVLVSASELDRLTAVRTAPWNTGSIQIGTCAGAAVWWAVDDEDDPPALAILVGHDDETWDVGVRLPLAVLDAILEEVRRVRA